MKRFSLNTAGRDFAVGDIHGAYSHLRRSLEAIGFDPAVDRLFSLGDLVDRGDESHEVLQWLDQPWFHAISGNHDFMIWRAALGDPYAHVDYRMHGGDWLDDLPQDEQRRIGERLAALPLAAEVETPAGPVGLVHADCPFDDWDEMHAVPWATIDHEGRVGDCCLWSIDRYRYGYTGKVRNVQAVVHGHMTIRTAAVMGNVHFIDTGGWRPGGYFTFLDLATLQPHRGPVLR